MAKRNRFEVFYDDGFWYVKDIDNGETHLSPTKASAVAIAVAIARGNEPSSLRIKRKNGTYQEERTYGGIDPYPPKG